MFKAAIFDLDGTLLYTLKDIADSVNYALSVQGYPTHPLESYNYFVGAGAREMLSRTIPADSGSLRSHHELIDALLEVYEKHYAEHQNDSTKPYDGVLEMLTNLTDNNIPICILSNKPHVSTLSVVAFHFNNIKFEAILGQREGVPTKPNPQAAFELAELLSIETSEILYVGDSGIDMQTGSAAGMETIGVLWGYRKADELNENGAKHLAQHPSEILKHFGL